MAARFDAPLSAGADASAHPEGALSAISGTEVNWLPEGYPKRGRDARIWVAIWPDDAAAQAFVDRRAEAVPLLTDAREHFAAIGHPFASHGPLNWSRDGEARSLYPVLRPNPGPDAPVIVITSLALDPEGDGLDLFGRWNREVRAAFRANPDALVEMQMMPDFPAMDGPTLSIWRSQSAMMNAAYKAMPHREAMQLNVTALAGGSFTRLSVQRLVGTWGGHDLDIPQAR